MSRSKQTSRDEALWSLSTSLQVFVHPKDSFTQCLICGAHHGRTRQVHPSPAGHSGHLREVPPPCSALHWDHHGTLHCPHLCGKSLPTSKRRLLQVPASGNAPGLYWRKAGLSSTRPGAPKDEGLSHLREGLSSLLCRGRGCDSTPRYFLGAAPNYPRGSHLPPGGCWHPPFHHSPQHTLAQRVERGLRPAPRLPGLLSGLLAPV